MFSFGTPNSRTSPVSGPNNATSLLSNLNNDSMNESGSQCAPSFLFGQTQHGMKRRNHPPTGPLTTPGILRSVGPNISPAGKSVHWSPLLVQESSEMRRAKVENDESAKGTNSLWSGPPLRSLMDEPPPEKQFRRNNAPFRQPSYPFANKSLNSGTRFSFTGNAVDDDENTADTSHQREQDYWVTVFGFPADQTEDVLDLFSKHGNIVSHKSPKSGNWINIRYSSTVHANQALSRNGMMFNGMMIGVVPCTDASVFILMKKMIADAPLNGDDNVIKFTAGNTTSNTSVAAQNASSSFANGSVVSTTADKSEFFMNGSRVVPSVNGSSINAFAPNDSLNSSRQSRLSISSRSGMRPLNRTDFLNNSNLNSSTQHKPDDSLLGKFWNYIVSS